MIIVSLCLLENFTLFLQCFNFQLYKKYGTDVKCKKFTPNLVSMAKVNLNMKAECKGSQ